MQSSIVILDSSGQTCGVGFYVTNSRVITALHNLQTYDDATIIYHGQYTDINERFVQFELKKIRDDADFDIAVFETERESSLFLSIEPWEDVNVGIKKLAITTFNIWSAGRRKEFKGKCAFGVMSGEFYRCSVDYLAYGCNAFSGDSGGVIIFSKTGKVIGMHLFTENQASEKLRLDEFKAKKVTDSINNIIAGYSQCFVGLRLDSQSVRNLILS